jgi:spore coat polysaccharide biosynthesis protein SpsF
VLLNAGGKALLTYHVERLQWSGYPVIIATTTEQADDAIVAFCDQHRLPCFRAMSWMYWVVFTGAPSITA